MRATWVLGVLLLTGCGAGRADVAVAEAPMPAPEPGMVGIGCEQAQAFAFSGETSLAAIGLGELAGGPDSRRIGMVWVTADDVSMFGPAAPPPGVPDEVARMVCVQWPDGSGMAGPVPPDWELPAAVDLEAPTEVGSPPLPLVGILVALALVAGVSFLAFRGERG